MMKEKQEKQILRISFVSGLIFAVVELIFAIYSHSQSVLTDAVYDASELVFIALLLFLTPLFYKPVSEKRPYGYFQIEPIFVIIKSVMMLSVTMGVLAEIIDSALSGGNAVNNTQISIFQFVLGVISILIFAIMKRLNENLTSPTVAAELLGWKLDIAYSMGMSLAFFASLYLKHTPIAFIVPYFDQVIAIVVMIMMLPESIKALWNAVKEVFLFSPEEEFVDEIKELCNPVLKDYRFLPVFYDITKTGRHLWIAIYFEIETKNLAVADLGAALKSINEKTKEKYRECSCELILVPNRNEG